MSHTTLLQTPEITGRASFADELREVEALPDLRDIACRLEHVDVRYGAVRALEGCTLEFVEGEVTALVGMPGSGRSTLARVVAGIDDITFGRLWIDGADASRLRDQSSIARRRRRAALLGDPDLIVPVGSAREHLDLALALDGVAPAERRASVDAALERAGLRRRAGAPVAALDHDERAALVLATALVGAPGLVVADDFGAGQDAPEATRRRDVGLARALQDACRASSAAALVVTTDPEVVAVADRVIALDEGRVYADLGAQTPAGAARLVHELATFAVLRG